MTNIEWFEKLVGTENVSDEIVDREVYSTDASQIKGKTDKVVWVTDAKQINQIIHYCRRHKKNIIPRGAGTSFVGSTVPFDSIVLDFSRMNKIEQIGKDYVVVEPGVVLDDLNNALKDRFFPIIPEDSAVCTIGGMCAINSSGIYEKKFGKMKDWVIDIDMIDGNGKLRRYSSEILGTEGTIGVFTKIKLKITAKINENSMDLLKFDKIEDIIEKITALKNNDEAIAIEYINRFASTLVGLDAKHYLIIEYSSFEGDIKDINDIERIWKIRKKVFNKLAQADYILMEDPFVPLENMTEFLYWLERNQIPCFGPIGASVLHPCFKDREAIKELIEAVNKLNGHFGTRFGLGLLKKDTLNKIRQHELLIMKAQFDPFNILNKDKLI